MIIKRLLFFIIGFIIPLFVYWTSGKDIFLRCDDLGGTISISIFFGFIGLYASYDIFGKK